MLVNTNENHAVRLARNQDHCRVLSSGSKALFRRDKNRFYAKILVEEVKGHLSCLTTLADAIRKADGCLASDMDGQRRRGAGEFEKVNAVDFQANSSNLVSCKEWMRIHLLTKPYPFLTWSEKLWQG